jgi:hypothetical protein
MVRVHVWRSAVAALVFSTVAASASLQQAPPAATVVDAVVPVASELDPSEEPLDEGSAMSWAKFTGRPVEVSAVTSETLKVTARPSGNFVAELSPGPVRVKQGDRWVPTDTSLVLDSDGRLVPGAASTDVSFSAGGDTDLVDVASSAGDLGLTWNEPLPEAVVDGNLATYPDVLPGIDLVVEAGVTGFATYLVVESRKAAQTAALDEIDFGLTTRGLALETGANGSLVASGEDGEPVLVATEPRMWDSAGAAAGAGGSENARNRVEESPGASVRRVAVAVSDRAVTLRPDRNFLLDPRTVYPVIIDPSWSSNSRSEIAFGMVWSNGIEFFNDSTQQARVGYDGWSSATKKSRTFYKFDTKFFDGKRIRSAIFRHHQVHSPSYTCDTNIGPAVQVWRANGFASGISWPGPTLLEKLATNDMAHGHQNYCSGYDINEWGVVSAVRWAADGGHSRMTLAMVSANEGNRDGWRKYKATSSALPKLVVEYNTTPNTPAAPTVAGSNVYSGVSYTNDTTPTFKAKLTDPDGNQLLGRFKLWKGSTLLWTKDSSWVNSGGTASVTVPSGILTADDRYWVEVRAYDDLNWSSFSQRTTFELDTVKPLPPEVKLPAHPISYGEGGKFTFSPAESEAANSDIVSYQYGFTTSTPTHAKNASQVGGSVTHLYSPMTFGPDWVTAVAVDRAGNVSDAVPADERVDFRVKGTEASHSWALDSGGADAVGGKPLSMVGAPSWGAGRYRTYDPFGDGGQSWAAGDDALGLDGVDDSARASGPVLDTSKSFSVSAWVNLAGGPESWATSVAQLGASRTAFNLGYAKGQGWGFWVRSSDDSSGVAATAAVPHDRSSDSGWTHLLGVYTAPRNSKQRKITLYVDGQFAAETPAPEGVFNATGDLVVGRAQFGGSPVNFWPGQIDDVRVFPGPVDPIGALALYTEIRDQEAAQ